MARFQLSDPARVIPDSGLYQPVRSKPDFHLQIAEELSDLARPNRPEYLPKAEEPYNIARC